MNAVTRKKKTTKQAHAQDSKAASSSTESQKQRKASMTSGMGITFHLTGCSTIRCVLMPALLRINAAPLLGGVRSSSRTHTVQNKKILEQKLKEYEEKRVSTPLHNAI